MGISCKIVYLTLFSVLQVPAAARAGAIAPCDVTVPAQNTGLGPEKTSFFQALGITTKISRGTIEILVRFKAAMLRQLECLPLGLDGANRSNIFHQ